MEDNFQHLGAIASGLVAGLKPTRAIDVIRPSSREEWLAGKKMTVGGSELPSLFGVNKHQSPYALFAEKAGLAKREFPEIEIRENSVCIPPTGRGNLFEDDAIECMRLLRPTWTVSPNPVPGGGCVYVDRQAGMSSTPDTFLWDPARPGKKGTLQIKSMAQMVFDREWKQDGEIIPPMSAAIQAIDDATLSGCDFAYVGAFVANFNIDFYLIEVPLHPQLMVKARELVADFWRRVAEDDPYSPDFDRDGWMIAQIYSEAEAGAEVDLSGNNRIYELLAKRDGYKSTERNGSEAEKARKSIDAEIINMLGNAARGRLSDGRLIEAPTTHRKRYMVNPSTYRTVKVKAA